MSKLNTLSKEEIEEELINDDLISSGGVENQGGLQKMDLEEKKNLLKGIKQSKEDFQSEASSKSLNQSALDNSPSNFPSLPAAGKSNSRNKLKLPRKQQSSGPKADSDDSQDKCIVLDDDEVTIPRFNLPFCVDDNAPPLPRPERPFRRVKNPYCVMKGESPAAAFKRMLAHHDSWKDQYTTETRRMESRALVEDIEDSDTKGERDSPKSDKLEEKENDPYAFVSDSPKCASKVYNGPRRREINQSSDTTQPSSRLFQRKTSRDSDCEEIEPILKPEEPKQNEWITTSRPRSKRNRKQLFNQGKGQIYESSPEVEFEFDSKWDAQTSTWGRGQTPSSSSISTRSQSRKPLPNTPELEEEKVQCPICQRNFALSKVETHAATCEGYSSSPMDVEEES